jgi:cell division septum initiation protein DivIVA
MSTPADDPRRAATQGESPRRAQATPRRAAAGDQYRMPEAQEILERVISIIEAAPGMPMSASVRVNREELLELLDDAVSRLPDELRSARWLLKEREDFLARTRREGEDLIEDARSRVAQMVQRTEVVKAAELRARQIVEEAEAAARRMRRETEDYCDQKLASFENVLARISKSVAAGRAKLAAPRIEEAELADLDDPPTGATPAVFDQES